MSKTLAALLLTLGTLLPGVSSAHCEIPCGIYTDWMRIDLIEEHVQTIEKSMTQIDALATADGGDANQLIRWVTNKEKHANEIQHIVTQYFLTQRIKPGQPDYHERLAVLHEMLIAAMKCKQTTDTAHTDRLRELSARFTVLYFDEEARTHLQGHRVGNQR